MCTTNTVDAPYADQIVEWKKIGSDKYVKCPRCDVFRTVSRDHLRRLLDGTRKNLCSKCGQLAKRGIKIQRVRKRDEDKRKNEKVWYKCERCGELRQLRRSTLQAYQSRGDEVVCQKCKGLKLCASGIITRPIMGPFPMIEGPSRELPAAPCYVCHGSYFLGHECHRYDACLDWAVATGMHSFVCGMPGSPHIHEWSPDRRELLDAYTQSIEVGFMAEQEQVLCLR